jgi:superfamily I DNA/RNA helicase
LPTGCESAEQYMQASRTGRGVALTRVQKRDLWPVFAEYRAQLRSTNLREPEEAYRDAIALLKREPVSLGIKAIVVDEAQDLSAAALELLRVCVPETPNDLFIVGDAHQRIYRYKVVLSRVGINVRGRGRRLRVNYRTTDEIRRWAVSQLANCSIDDLDGQPDTLMGYQSLTHGEAPVVISSSSRGDERKALLETLKRFEHGGIEPRNTCVVLRKNEEVNEYAEWLVSEGFDVLLLTRDVSDDDARPGIRVATMHRVKGLEFDAVVIAGFRGAQKYAEIFADDGDAGVMVDMLTSERCLLHVAATRAKRALVVSQIES